MLFAFLSINAQSYLKSKEKKAYKCGYVYKPSFLSKLKPMKGVGKLVVGAISRKPYSDLGKTAIGVAYVSNLSPQHNLDFMTKSEGYETCGEAVSVGFIDTEGLGLTDTDGDVKLNGTKLEGAGFGTYFQGFPASDSGTKKIEITSSNGDNIKVEIEPAAPLEILTIDGKAKNEDIVIDGTKDISIELKGGDLDKKSKLYVALVVKGGSVKFQTYVFITDPANHFVIPKEAFKNYGITSIPLVAKNTWSVSRVVQNIKYDTDANLIQTVAVFSDFAPVLVAGDIEGGTIIGNYFDKEKNGKVGANFKVVESEYNFKIIKDNASVSPPIGSTKKMVLLPFL